MDDNAYLDTIKDINWDTFYQQNLKLFIDNDLSLEDGDNNVIIREDIIAQLETAQKIRDIFFSKQVHGCCCRRERVQLSRP